MFSQSEPNGGNPEKGNALRQSMPRTYDKTWEEIEDMLDQASERMQQWKAWYENCKEERDVEGQKEAARNYKALQGVHKTLRWVLGEQGVENPLH